MGWMHGGVGCCAAARALLLHACGQKAPWRRPAGVPMHLYVPFWAPPPRPRTCLVHVSSSPTFLPQGQPALSRGAAPAAGVRRGPGTLGWPAGRLQAAAADRQPAVCDAAGGAACAGVTGMSWRALRGDHGVFLPCVLCPAAQRAPRHSATSLPSHLPCPLLAEPGRVSGGSASRTGRPRAQGLEEGMGWWWGGGQEARRGEQPEGVCLAEGLSVDDCDDWTRLPSMPHAKQPPHVPRPSHPCYMACSSVCTPSASCCRSAA